MLNRRNALGLGLAALAAPAAAQAGFPERPLRWIVGYPPGGPSDAFARLIGAQMAPRLGQNVLIENRVGGGAVLASETAARAAPNGYTWLHVDNGILTYNPALYARLPYNPDTDLTGVGFIGRFPLYIVVRREGGRPASRNSWPPPARGRPPMARPPSPPRTIWPWRWSAAARGWTPPMCPIAAGRPPCRI